MRSLVILLALAAPAAADDGPTLPRRMVGWGIDGQMIDAGGGQAVGFGVDGIATYGHGRVALLLEGGGGGLMSDHPSDALGAFVTARVGGRVLLASTSRALPFGMDLTLDGGVGDGVYWLDGAGLYNRPQVFAGWGTLLRGDAHAFHFELRFAVSPRLDDADAIRAICRGTCTMPSSEPVDVTMQLVVGVASW